MSDEVKKIFTLDPDTPTATTPPIDAATVALVRDGAEGVETLMLRKNSKIAFGGMWVFPGGRVDDEDRADPLGDDDLGAHRAAAVREAAEEADVVLPRVADDIVPLSFWMPPAIEVKRFATWFFVARVPRGDAGVVAVDQGEILDEQWARPQDLLARRDAGEVQLVPPTWITLHTFARYATVDELLQDTRAQPSPRFITRAGMLDDTLVTMWEGDAGYEANDVTVLDGPRNRLVLAEPNWRYEVSPA